MKKHHYEEVVLVEFKFSCNKAVELATVPQEFESLLRKLIDPVSDRHEPRCNIGSEKCESGEK